MSPDDDDGGDIGALTPMLVVGRKLPFVLDRECPLENQPRPPPSPLARTLPDLTFSPAPVPCTGAETGWLDGRTSNRLWPGPVAAQRGWHSSGQGASGSGSGVCFPRRAVDFIAPGGGDEERLLRTRRNNSLKRLVSVPGRKGGPRRSAARREGEPLVLRGGDGGRRQ